MSSVIYISFEEGCAVELDQFEKFCRQHGVRYSPNTVGRNVFYGGDVEITFGKGNYVQLPMLDSGKLDFSLARPHESAEQVAFSTYFMGDARPGVVRLAMASGSGSAVRSTRRPSCARSSAGRWSRAGRRSRACR